MCFSAEASFAASGVLGATSMAIARLPKERASRPLALFPAIFAVHQLTEGILWLGHDGVVPDGYDSAALYLYAIIAFSLWPMLVPASAFLLEAEKGRRRIVLACQVIGLGVGLSYLVAIVRGPVSVAANCCGLSYQVRAPWQLGVPYLLAVSLPFLASSRRSLMLFGAAVALSAGAAALAASNQTFPSVWCFFAALLSGSLYLHFRAEARAMGHAQSEGIVSGALAHWVQRHGPTLQ
ncbi:MAG TPA: hypothetical protein PKO09_12930 [Anaerolineae bacterium]|nr:hypothetical protein [Anaerolineae bacterium]